MVLKKLYNLEFLKKMVSNDLGTNVLIVEHLPTLLKFQCNLTINPDIWNYRHKNKTLQKADKLK